MAYDFSSDEKHQATLDLMRDVLTYLRRLPPVPVTTAFCQRIEDHLAEPTQVLLADYERELFGDVVSPIGLQVMRATLTRQRLHLQTPDPDAGEQGLITRRQVAMEVMTQLWGKGISLQLGRSRRWPLPDDVDGVLGS